LAPPRIQKGLSYLVGWLTAMGWQVYLAGICLMVGSMFRRSGEILVFVISD
jgi:choline transport protein